MTANFEGRKLVAAGGSSRIGRDSAADVVAGGGGAVMSAGIRPGSMKRSQRDEDS
jgi:hypothetical protein